MSNVVPFPKPAKRVRLARRPWKRLRDRVCATGRCVGCTLYRGPEWLDAHHVYGRDLGGDDVVENLVPLCRTCHDDLHDHAPGWELIAARIRRVVADSHAMLLYLVRKLGTVDAARVFLDRYYPERPTREGGNDAA